jgi:tRNA pseudouridine65 synthase
VDRPAIAVIHRDDDLVVVDKPAGLAVHRSKLVGADDDYLVDRIRAQLGTNLYLAHRLDRATSGLVVLAASREAAGVLGQAFMAREVHKTYLAVCRGWPAAEGEIDYPLAAGPRDPPKPALTRWRTLATGELPVAMGRYPVQRYALVAIEPETGRHQQIRRHFHHLSHHLLGDTTHGRGDHNRLFRIHLGSHRLLLHAWRLAFRHPRHNVALQLEAPPDADFRRVLDQFRWPLPPAAPAA